MTSLTVDWGDVPTWVGALTTLAALIAAAGLLRLELKRDSFAAAEATERREDSARAQQADLVAAWKDTKDTDEWAAIRNGSQLPIYDVQLELVDSKSLKTYFAEFGTVPPAERMPVWVVQDSANTDVRSPGPGAEFLVTLSFSDTAGRRWKRDYRGVLHRIS